MLDEDAEDAGGRALLQRLPRLAGALRMPQGRCRGIRLRVPVGGRPRRNPWLAHTATSLALGVRIRGRTVLAGSLASSLTGVPSSRRRPGKFLLTGWHKKY